MSAMVHMRIVAPPEVAAAALELLEGADSVVNIVSLRGAALRPDGDVILCDVAREDTSVILSDLRRLDIEESGSISLEAIDTQLSKASEEAERAAPGMPSDAVIWEELISRTSEDAELSISFLAFMTLATLIAAVGIYLNTAILIIGAMIVGPDFGPIAGFCVAAVQLRRGLALKSALALAVGFPVAMTAVFVATLVFEAIGVIPDHLPTTSDSLGNVIANPGFFAFFVAFCAGIAGILSLTSAKSGALIGVLVSVTTIPAAANIGVAAAYGDWPEWSGSMQQLLINLASIFAAGLLTVYVQRLLYRRRWRLRAKGAAVRGPSPGTTRRRSWSARAR